MRRPPGARALICNSSSTSSRLWAGAVGTARAATRAWPQLLLRTVTVRLLSALLAFTAAAVTEEAAVYIRQRVDGARVWQGSCCTVATTRVREVQCACAMGCALLLLHACMIMHAPDHEPPQVQSSTAEGLLARLACRRAQYLCTGRPQQCLQVGKPCAEGRAHGRKQAPPVSHHQLARIASLNRRRVHLYI